MMRMKFCWALVGLWLMVSGAAVAQVSTTTVSDTLYHADGSPAQGTLLISWPQFTTAGGAAVSAGSTTVTLSSGGGLSVALAPNAGSNPIGSYYTVVYHLDDGTLTRENWMVPVSGSAVHLTAVRSTVLPTSVAMQTVTKAYVDSAIASTLATNSIPPAVSLQSVLAASPFLMSVGGCQDNGGIGLEGFVFQSAAADGTPTCNGYVSTDGEGTISMEDSAGDENIMLEGSSGTGVFGGVVQAAGFNAVGNKAVNLADGTAPHDAATLEQIPVGASASVAGVVKLASGQTSTTLSTIATTGSAGDIGSGTLADGRLSANVPLKGAGNIFAAMNTFNFSTIFHNASYYDPTGTATSSANFASNQLDWYGTFWTGSAAANDFWTASINYGTGANPTSTLTFAHPVGTGGLSTVSFPALVVTPSTPGSSSAACVTGQIWTDASYVYVCTAASTIKRVALSSF